MQYFKESGRAYTYYAVEDTFNLRVVRLYDAVIEDGCAFRRLLK